MHCQDGVSCLGIAAESCSPVRCRDQDHSVGESAADTAALFPALGCVCASCLSQLDIHHPCDKLAIMSHWRVFLPEGRLTLHCDWLCLLAVLAGAGCKAAIWTKWPIGTLTKLLGAGFTKALSVTPGMNMAQVLVRLGTAPRVMWPARCCSRGRGIVPSANVARSVLFLSLPVRAEACNSGPQNLGWS